VMSAMSVRLLRSTIRATDQDMACLAAGPL
jgi:hypothetical protein